MLTAKSAKAVAARPVRRQTVVPCALPEDSNTKQQQQAAGESEADINSRILSGEFTDAGSTKEKLTRPIRKALAQDPVGIGKSSQQQGGVNWTAGAGGWAVRRIWQQQ